VTRVTWRVTSSATSCTPTRCSARPKQTLAVARAPVDYWATLADPCLLLLLLVLQWWRRQLQQLQFAIASAQSNAAGDGGRTQPAGVGQRVKPMMLTHVTRHTSRVTRHTYAHDRLTTSGDTTVTAESSLRYLQQRHASNNACTCHTTHTRAACSHVTQHTLTHHKPSLGCFV